MLTAAHLFVSPSTLQLYHGHRPERVTIAIGVYEGDAAPSRWAWWAELLTPLEILREKDEKGHASRGAAAMRVHWRGAAWGRSI